MIFRPTLCACLASLLVSAAAAQDTKHISLKECPEEVSANDPSIATIKVVIASHPCTGSALELRVIDKRYGFVSARKRLAGLPGWVRVVSPTRDDWFVTHKPCRVTYPEQGTFMEWLVRHGVPCDGRHAGWYYRVYTTDMVCTMPGEHCVPINHLRGTAQHRVTETLQIAYNMLH